MYTPNPHSNPCLADLKLLCEMLLKIIIGKGIDAGDGGWKGWNRDMEHRVDSAKRGIFRDIWPDRMGPLPWRLTKEELNELDERMKRCSWPHYVDRLEYDNASFWLKPSRLWKTTRKIVLFLYVLSSQLRDKLPRLRTAIHMLTRALRKLDGQVHSYEDAVNQDILPGSRTVDPSEMAAIHRDIIIGLCLLEGSLPVKHLHPALHHIAHFAQYTLTHGCLRILWMMFFERYNKYLKNLVRDASHPEAHLANSVTKDVSARYMKLVVDRNHEVYTVAKDPHHNCFLSQPDIRFDCPTRKEISDLRQLGVAADCLSMAAFKAAHIMGVHFSAGERVWGQRCGSVFTCVMKTRQVRARSYYGRVIRFLTVDGDDTCPGYASVKWFGRPVYPHDNFLVVRVGCDGSAVERTFGSVIRITQIQPSRVIVESPLGPVEKDFYMMRDSGYDTYTI